ncbi:fungal-specific transcription factor domain-containing protein [Xylaria curta]|nr:fungal-specific transcription factor domain-containing protein [Xylaria curta]
MLRPPMRCRIACTRCRRSKLKCEKNDNGASPCENCVKAGIECIYKTPDPRLVPLKRREPPAPVEQENRGTVRKRLRYFDNIPRVIELQSCGVAKGVLSAPFLTDDVWEQVFDLYKLHFAPELSFLHIPTMREELARRRASGRSPNPERDLVFLGLLTLTARFLPDLVQYTGYRCKQPSDDGQPDPALASEYYAGFLDIALGSVRTMTSTPSIDRVAALLMLGFYEWSRTMSGLGSMSARVCVVAATEMGFRVRDENMPGDDAGRETNLRLREIRRRIMFSCFILDRMLASSERRLPTIRDDFAIQLPCSEDKFDLAIEVHTGRLTQLERHGSDDNVLSRFIQLVAIWGDICIYSRGGHARDTRPPWHPESEFHMLRSALDAYNSALPSSFTFSPSNYTLHENHGASSPFVLLHMLRFISLILLHREHLPFVPLRCRMPEGPFPLSTFATDETSAGFWRLSAAQLFQAARDIANLTEICQRKAKLPHSPIVLFTLWVAALVGLYGAHFPHMDTERHVSPVPLEDPPEDGLESVFAHGPTAMAFQALKTMSTWSKPASAYVDVLRGIHDRYNTVKQDYSKYVDRAQEDGARGGLEGYQTLVEKLTSLGSLQPDEDAAVDVAEQPRIQAWDRSPSGTGRLSPFRAIRYRSILPAPEMTQPPNRVESWRYFDTSQQPDDPSPLQAYPQQRLVPDLEGTHTPACQSSEDERENFWAALRKDELRPLGVPNDLSLLSTVRPVAGEENVRGSPLLLTEADSSPLLWLKGA